MAATVHSSVAVLWAFLRLGLMSFGGPIAHLGYFREEFVARRRWLDDGTYTDLVALCQFLPGPASSQVGFCIGLIRAGYLGGLAAWTGFTLPSAVAMVLFAYGAHLLAGPVAAGVLHGLELVAVAIIAQAVFGMARTLCPDWQRAAIASLAALLMLWVGSAFAQVGVIVFGGAAGFLLCRSGAPQPATPQPATPMRVQVSRRIGVVSLVAFMVLLVGLPVLRALGAAQAVTWFGAFYRSGALVFGGGHVVLPLLRDAFVGPGWVGDDAFLAGYGAAQALPGPLFAFAAYLGVIVAPLHGASGALLGIIGIFLPGMLVLTGTLPFWDTLRARSSAQAAMRGVNAAVVGLLAAALYSPVGTHAINSKTDFAAALSGFLLLTVWHLRPLLLVLLGALTGIILCIAK